MIYSVIYGMVNFWSSVFVLPKRFYAKVDSLCYAFLWKNNTSSAVGARVAWPNICKPKKEGGLGIRKLEEFEMVFHLKRVWLFFSSSGSLWVPWLAHNRFRGLIFGWLMILQDSLGQSDRCLSLGIHWVLIYGVVLETVALLLSGLITGQSWVLCSLYLVHPDLGT